MKLQQNQIWKKGSEYIRIVNLERMAVDYKTMKDLTTKEGTHTRMAKKEFCRMLKHAKLLGEGTRVEKTRVCEEGLDEEVGDAI